MQPRSSHERLTGDIPQQIADAQLQRAVTALLSRHFGPDAEAIRVIVHHGAVTLTGDVASAALGFRVVDTLYRLPGIRVVRNHLRVQH